MIEGTCKHVHFMGILGSGCASIAMLASEAGYRVSGCDQQTDSYYADELRKKGVRIYQGHDSVHLDDDVDIVAISPALYDINPDNPELKRAEESGILMTWQEFMGKYLQQDKRVIAIAGTHGKTTTTFLSAELLIDAGLDPTVEGGSVYHKWGIGARSGKSDFFICEADEFNRNFYHYTPEVLVLNNVEMDHPECFGSFEELLQAFCHFVTEGGRLKTLILNADSEGALEVLRRTAGHEALRQVRILAFSRKHLDYSDIPLNVEECVYRTERKDSKGTQFIIEKDGISHPFFMRLFGEYNVSNAVSAILAAWSLEVPDETVRASLSRFEGVGRRFDNVGSFRGVQVYDDYAHHPTEISAVLTMCRDYYPDQKLLVIFEPHQVSRLTLMFDEYAAALCIADHVIVGRTHIGREVLKNVVPISGERWESASDKIVYEEDRRRILALTADLIEKHECSMIVVIGAANSYKLSRYLCNEGKE